MKTTALIFLSFFLVLSGPMKTAKKGQMSESVFNFFTPSNQNLNYSNEVVTNRSFLFLSNYTTLKENAAEVVRPSLEFNNSLSNFSNLESGIFSEKDISFENWMTEVSEFNKDASIFTDDEIRIEEWMTGMINFSMESNVLLEQDLTIEDWMKNPDTWKVNTVMINIIPEIVTEADPAIEEWMTQPQSWIETNN